MVHVLDVRVPARAGKPSQFGCHVAGLGRADTLEDLQSPAQQSPAVTGLGRRQGAAAQSAQGGSFIPGDVDRVR